MAQGPSEATQPLTPPSAGDVKQEFPIYDPTLSNYSFQMFSGVTLRSPLLAVSGHRVDTN